MGLNDTPLSERLHIAFFGRRNSGKSSLLNRISGQELAVVSDTPGTTTDPVYKSMELLPLGPVVLIDTPGFDDEGELGEKRVKKTRQILNKADVAVFVTAAGREPGADEREFLELCAAKEIPCIKVYTKSDLTDKRGEDGVNVSSLTGEGIRELKERLGRLAPAGSGIRFVGDVVDPGQTVVLVTPIDSAAPKGRIILPQQHAIRDLLDIGATAIVTRETELESTLGKLSAKPDLVITDSQKFGIVSKILPRDILLTSFSILMARYKGFLSEAVKGAEALKNIADGDRILISEGCTHHRQCGDIGTVKLPAMIRRFTGAEPKFEFSSGGGFPEDLEGVKVVIHCGGCMLGEREVRYRMKSASDQGIPFTNFGITMAMMNGILERSTEVLRLRGLL